VAFEGNFFTERIHGLFHPVQAALAALSLWCGKANTLIAKRPAGVKPASLENECCKTITGSEALSTHAGRGMTVEAADAGLHSGVSLISNSAGSKPKSQAPRLRVLQLTSKKWSDSEDDFRTLLQSG
jgi:hypothetical protein